MDRRLIITALACWPAGRLLAQDGSAQPRHKISAAQLHEALSARFPVRVGMGGLAEVEISAPSLLLMPSRQKLGASLVAKLGGPQLQPVAPGELDLVFALRYEPSDQTVRAHDPEVLALRWPGLSPQATQTLHGVLDSMSREAIGEVVLRKLTPRELSVADTMGFEPEKLEVVHDGVVVLFGPKRAR